jgi:hypothetical protein
MSIYRQTVTLTIFSKAALDPAELSDHLKSAVADFDAVSDVALHKVHTMTNDEGGDELWERGFDPDVLDGYDIQTYTPEPHPAIRG